jgi:signal transduction histidine kinase
MPATPVEGRAAARAGERAEPVRIRVQRDRLADAAVAAALVAFTVGAAVLGGWDLDGPATASAVTLEAAAGAAVAFRRRAPGVAMLAAAGTTSAALVLGAPYGPALLSVAVAAYSLARYRPTATAVGYGVAAMALLAVHTLSGPGLAGALGLVPGSAWVVVPFSIGLARRMTTEATARARAEAERHLVDSERLRLAQEVHDIVGHGLAAIRMQADVALHLRATRPDQAHTALETISRSSAEALAELRMALSEVRPAGAAEGGGGPSAHGIDRVAELCQRVRDAGVEVALTVVGRRRPLPDPVEAAAYRVVQESLTNVLKHAPTRRATITISYREAALELDVRNPGAAAGPAGRGLGIPGMRRRVESLDGRFEAGPVAGGDAFRVRAELPT